MRLSIIVSFLFLISSPVFSQSSKNINLLSQYSYSASRGDGSDIWGYVDGSGNEYAIVGLENGVSVVDVTNSANPVEVFYQSGTQTIWRDIKVWNDHAYITNEGGNGLMIIDLAPLPSSTNLTVSYFTGSTFPFQTAHNLYIDENGVAYIFGSDYSAGGAIMLDLTSSATNPTELGVYDTYYIHDGFVRNDTLWASCVNDGFFAVVDVSNKSNPSTLASQITPHSFAHNGWLSDDGDHFYTTDEVSGAYLAAYDVSNLSNISETDRIQSNPGSGVIPHNTHFMNEYLVTSYYRDGVTIHDVSNPDNMVEVGHYDTSPLSGDGFDGCWGVYPWLPSGNIIASDIQGGLFVLGPTYTRGCFLKGNVAENGTGIPLGNAMIEILSTPVSDMTNINGDYSTGIADSGTYDIRFTKGGYRDDTVKNVTLYHDSTIVVNALLDPKPTFTLNGRVVEKNTTDGIPSAKVDIDNGFNQYNVQTNANGDFTIPDFYKDEYDVLAGKWGYRNFCQDDVTIDSNGTYVIELEIGYYDDFSLDFNWMTNSFASTGDWERGVPVGTSLSGSPSNPGVDVTGDCRDKAFVTGNGGGSAGDDDIDDGRVYLTSPTFDLTLYKDPHVTFYRWYYNDGGWGSPNDTLSIILSNGTTSALIDQVTPDSTTANQWTYRDFRIADYMSKSSTMELQIVAGDDSPGHIMEAAFDMFMITGDTIDTTTTPSAIASVAGQQTGFSVAPNPFEDQLTINYHYTGASEVTLEVFDITGKIIRNERLLKGKGRHTLTGIDKPGMYFLRLEDDKGRMDTEKVVKQ